MKRITVSLLSISPNSATSHAEKPPILMHLDLHVLCVLLEYQRKGLGKILLEHLLADPDIDHAKVSLQATEFGYGLYLHYGWKDIEDMITKTPEGPVIWKYMMRDP
jgi:GNAT superfamily N-acetyltransferase